MRTSRGALSITKSWMVPWQRTAAVGTPPPRALDVAADAVIAHGFIQAAPHHGDPF
jgi:hypothetical protein